MLGENGYPETPDWLPESRDGVAIKPHAECPAHVSEPLTYEGDQA